MPFPVSEGVIVAAERNLGRRLPDPLRHRLLRSNGGSVVADGERWHVLPVWDPTNRRTIARTTSHIGRQTAGLRQELPDLFPATHLAIAVYDYGDYLVVAPSDEIERWSHETGATRSVEVSW